MPLVRSEICGPVLILRLDRPQARNAFNRQMADEMEVLVDRYEADTALRAAVLCAEGETFCAGQDLKEAATGGRAWTSGRGWFGILGRPPTKPLIAAVEGQALAGGMELTLCCDLVVASSASVFGLAEVRHGLVAVGGGCFRLPRRLPEPIAMELILTGQPMTASRLKEYGFVNSVVSPGAVRDEAMRYAELIAANGPLAVKASKQIAMSATAERWSDEEAWARQTDIVAPVLASLDLQEGLKAFVEKRSAMWQGR